MTIISCPSSQAFLLPIDVGLKIKRSNKNHEFEIES